MAQSFQKRIQKYFNKINLQESYATIVLGGIIVIVFGLLVANYFSKKGQDIGNAEQTSKDQQQVTTQEHKVAPGDSLSLISEKYYGSRDFWPVLARANKIKNPNIIFVDSTLQIPPKSEAEQTRTLMTQTSYKVESGDTLFAIAEKVYGDGSKWTILDRANGSRRLPNGNPLVFADSTITVPR